MQTSQLMAILRLDNKLFLSGIKQSETSVLGFGKRVSTTLTQVGAGLSLAFTAPLAFFGKQAVQAEMDFEKSMSKVSAYADVTGKSLDKLRQQALSLGMNTQFSAKQAADAMSVLALAGWNVNSIYAGTPAVLNMAAAGQMDLTQAADITTSTLALFNLTADKSNHIVDVLTQTATQSKTDILGLSESMKYGASTAAQYGNDLESVMTVFGVLGNLGVEGSTAGTGFNQMLDDLIMKQKNGKVAFNQFSIAVYDQQGKMRNALDIIKDFQKAANGMTDRQKGVALTNLFDVRAVRVMERLLTVGPQGMKEMETSIRGADGAAKKMSDTLMNNLWGDFIKLKAAWNSVKLSFGAILDAPLRSLATWAKIVMVSLNSMSNEQKVMILLFGGGIALIGPLIVSFGMLSKIVLFAASGIRTLVMSMFSLQAISLGVIGVIALVMASVGLFKLIKPHLDSYIASLNEADAKKKAADDALKASGNPDTKGLKATADAYKGIGDAAEAAGGKTFAFDKLNQIDTTIVPGGGNQDFQAKAMQQINQAAEDSNKQLENMVSITGILANLKGMPFVEELIKWAKGSPALKDMLTSVETLGTKIGALILQILKFLGLWDTNLTLKENLDNIAKKIGDVADGLAGIVKYAADNPVAFTVDVILAWAGLKLTGMVIGAMFKNMFAAAGRSIATSTASLFSGMWESIVIGTKMFMSSMNTAFLRVGTWLVTRLPVILGDAFSAMGRGLIQVITKLNPWAAFITMFIALFAIAWNNNWFGFTEEKKKAFLDMWSMDKLNEFVTSIKKWVNGIWLLIKLEWRVLVADVSTWGANLVDGFVNGAKDKWNSLKSFFSNMTKDISQYLGFHSPAKKGEGRFITVWGENMVNGFMDGVKSMSPVLNAHVSGMMDSLGGVMNGQEFSSVSAANSRALKNTADSPIGSSSDAKNGDLHLHAAVIDKHTLRTLERQLDVVRREEKQRLGGVATQ